MSSIEFQDGMFVKGKREGFQASVIREFRGVDETAICHVVSYAIIRDMVIGAMNEMLANNVQGGKKLISSLIAAVILTESGSGDEDDVSEQKRECRGILNSLIMSVRDIAAMLDKGNMLISKLNSCIYNLRRGDPYWNRFVSDRFDPNEWYYLEENDQHKILLMSSNSGFYDDPEPFNLERFGTGFYIENQIDCLRLYYLLNPAAIMPETPFPNIQLSFNVGIYENRYGGRYMASSQNRFRYSDQEEDMQELDVSEIPIYYHYGGLYYLLYNITKRG